MRMRGRRSWNDKNASIQRKPIVHDEIILPAYHPPFDARECHRTVRHRCEMPQHFGSCPAFREQGTKYSEESSGRTSMSTSARNIMDPLLFDYYDLPSASDMAAFRDDLAREQSGRKPAQIVIIGVAKWFGRTVAQRIIRHTRDYRGGQELVAIDLVMFLLTEGHELEHCSMEIYASHFPSLSKLCMNDLEAQALDLGKTFRGFDVKYARVWDRESLDAFRTRVSGSGVNVASMNGDDWKFLRTLERQWVVP